MNAYSFSSESRIRDKAGYTNVFARPKYKKKNSAYTVLAIKSEQSKARLGVVVAKKNVKRAVDRNKIKRQVRESFRLQQDRLQGLDIVVVVRRPIAQPPQIFNGVGV